MKADGSIEEIRNYPSPNPHIKLQEITYWSDGIKVKGLLAEPIEDGEYEGIIYLRGGIQHVGMVRPSRIAQFASNGFVVFAPYYRGNRGGGGRDEFAGRDRLDAIHAVDVLKQSSKVNRHRIHLFAFSRGGIMALWAAIERADITSVVTWAGVSDVAYTYYERKDLRRMMRRVIGGTPKNHPQAYEDRNALKRVTELHAPVLIIHGMLDEHVSPEQASRLESELEQHHKQHETWYYPNFTHHIPPMENTAIVRALCLWMKKQPTLHLR